MKKEKEDKKLSPQADGKMNLYRGKSTKISVAKEKIDQGAIWERKS